MSKSTKKLRVHYIVHNDLGLWWHGRRLGWKTLGDAGCGCSNSRIFYTKKKALAHLVHMGKGFSVTQFNPHCGWMRQVFKSGTWLTDRIWDATKPGLGMELVKDKV